MDTPSAVKSWTLNPDAVPLSSDPSQEIGRGFCVFGDGTLTRPSARVRKRLPHPCRPDLTAGLVP
jgi:hypothetical protein